jgi:hypothetical protein
VFGDGGCHLATRTFFVMVRSLNETLEKPKDMWVATTYGLIELWDRAGVPPAKKPNGG